MQNSKLAPPPRNRTLYPSGISSSSFINASASSITGWKSLLRWLISIKERPQLLNSRHASAVALITSLGNIDGPALKLYFFIIYFFIPCILSNINNGTIPCSRDKSDYVVRDYIPFSGEFTNKIFFS